MEFSRKGRNVHEKVAKSLQALRLFFAPLRETITTSLVVLLIE
jgi:hypothetical protein